MEGPPASECAAADRTVSENQFAMISDWMTNGNVNETVKAYPDANKLELVSCSFRVPCLH